MICGGPAAPADVLRTLTGLSSCCLGATISPSSCTCWEPIYDKEQSDPDVTVPPSTRMTACDDCAYRAGSPERSGDEHYAADFDRFDASIFWCHQGMRKPVAWRHPTLGITVDTTGDYYDPPIVRDENGEGVPFRADGTPGDRCAGWAARRRALEAPLVDYLTESREEVESL